MMHEETPAPGSKRAIRQQNLLGYLIEHGQASAAELAEFAAVSVMTVHRDIEDFKSRGLIRKFHGGVSMLPTSAFESSAQFRRGRNVAAKNALARIAVTLVEPGMSVMLDDSTTVYALAELLTEVTPLTVISNFRQVAGLFYDLGEIEFFMIGGLYSRTHDSYISPASQTGLNNFTADLVFQSSSTMDCERTYHQEQYTMELKRSMLDCGQRKVLMMDGSKVGKTALHRFAELSEFSDVILTDDVDADTVTRIAELTRVHIAPM